MIAPFRRIGAQRRQMQYLQLQHERVAIEEAIDATRENVKMLEEAAADRTTREEMEDIRWIMPSERRLAAVQLWGKRTVSVAIPLAGMLTFSQISGAFTPEAWFIGVTAGALMGLFVITAVPSMVITTYNDIRDYSEEFLGMIKALAQERLGDLQRV